MKRPLIWIACGISVATLAWAGCGDETNASDDDGGTGGTTQTSSSSNAVSSSSTGNASSSSSSSSSGAGGGTTIDCNPVTNEPCTTGQACDATQGGGFICFDPPNDSMICEACDNGTGPFCAGGLGCADGTCAKYCCTSADCGTGNCTTGGFPIAPDLGICDAGAGGGGGGTPGCDAPATPPSGGSCVTVQ